ncbi:MAG TPA: hypothetical protein PK197_03550 [Candidatus Cloacimonas sp.]|nr:hypothetical protein [Candidatus Cloacimonas sp.]
MKRSINVVNIPGVSESQELRIIDYNILIAEINNLLYIGSASMQEVGKKKKRSSQLDRCTHYAM